MNISLIENDISGIESIRPLWEKLNLVHLNKSMHFKSKYETFTFEQRTEILQKKAQTGIVKVDLLLDHDTGHYIGYCVSSIEDHAGEVESIYIEEQYRRYKLGDKLMKSALRWFKQNGITQIEINVVYGNEEALPFYQKYGFQIGSYILRRK